MNIVILSLLTFISASGLNRNSEEMHAIYVSVLEIEDIEAKSGELRLKVFTDDLEDAIYNQVGIRYDLKGDCNLAQEAIQRYLSDHLELIIDNQKVSIGYISCEINDISLWITFSFSSNGQWTKVDLKADYLMELFPTQSNVVSITLGEEKRMFRLLKGDVRKTVNF
jgi:hypothetical protein